MARKHSQSTGSNAVVTLSAVTTLTFLILLEGLLDDDTKPKLAGAIVAFAVSEVLLDIFVISPELEAKTQKRRRR